MGSIRESADYSAQSGNYVRQRGRAGSRFLRPETTERRQIAEAKSRRIFLEVTLMTRIDRRKHNLRNDDARHSSLITHYCPRGRGVTIHRARGRIYHLAFFREGAWLKLRKRVSRFAALQTSCRDSSLEWTCVHRMELYRVAQKFLGHHCIGDVAHV